MVFTGSRFGAIPPAAAQGNIQSNGVLVSQGRQLQIVDLRLMILSIRREHIQIRAEASFAVGLDEV